MKNEQFRDTDNIDKPQRTEGSMKNEQFRDTGNIEHKTQNEDKQTKTKQIGNTDNMKTVV